jgi:hypothetical protein
MPQVGRNQTNARSNGQNLNTSLLQHNQISMLEQLENHIQFSVLGLKKAGFNMFFA